MLSFIQLIQKESKLLNGQPSSSGTWYADGHDQAVEGDWEDEVEGPPAGGRQGRADFHRAQRNQLAQVKPCQWTEAGVVSDQEYNRSGLNSPGIFLWKIKTLKHTKIVLFMLVLLYS